MESNGRVKYYNGKYFRNLKKNKDENFQLLSKIAADLKFLSQKLQTFLIMKMYFLFWFIKYFWGYTEDDLPLNKQLKFPTVTLIIRCVLQKDEKLYTQIYLDKCLYEIV